MSFKHQVIPKSKMSSNTLPKSFDHILVPTEFCAQKLEKLCKIYGKNCAKNWRNLWHARYKVVVYKFNRPEQHMILFVHSCCMKQIDQKWTRKIPPINPLNPKKQLFYVLSKMLNSTPFLTFFGIGVNFAGSFLADVFHTTTLDKLFTHIRFCEHGPGAE